MPELPEVETVANSVDARVRGQRIGSGWLSRYKEPFKTSRTEMAEALSGLRIELVRRGGKHIVVDFRRGGCSYQIAAQWVVHLGMTGRLLVTASKLPVEKHTHAALSLSGGRELRFIDARRFGRLAFYPALNGSEGFRGPGREPLTISEADFVALF